MTDAEFREALKALQIDEAELDDDLAKKLRNNLSRVGKETLTSAKLDELAEHHELSDVAKSVLRKQCATVDEATDLLEGLGLAKAEAADEAGNGSKADQELDPSQLADLVSRRW
jgi:hypothetical protein